MAKSYRDVLEQRGERINPMTGKPVFPLDRSQTTLQGFQDSMYRYLLAWRHNANCPWYIVQEIHDSMNAVREAAKVHAKYDMAKREYAVIPIVNETKWELL